jgi:hypothetical protein
MSARKRLLWYLVSYLALLGVACRFGVDPAENGAAIGGAVALPEPGIGYVSGPDDGEWHVVPPNEGRAVLKAGPRSVSRWYSVVPSGAPPAVPLCLRRRRSRTFARSTRACRDEQLASA